MNTFNKYIWYVGAFFLVILISFFLYTHFFRSVDIKNYPSSGDAIVAFGDSLVFGQGASSQDNGFVALLSKRIGKPIINLGVPGNTTADALARIGELDRYKPKVVLVLLGGNDYLQKVPIETTFKNIEKIIQNLQARGAVVVLLGVRGGLLNDKFETEFEKISARYKTAYVSDVLSGLITNNEYMSDAVHPNDAGYQKIADRVYPVLLKVLK